MRSQISRALPVLILAVAPAKAVRCQSIVRAGRFYHSDTAIKTLISPPPDVPRKGDTKTQYVTSAAVGVWPFDRAKGTIDSHVIGIDLYGRPDSVTDAAGNRGWQSHVALHVDINTHVIDAFGDEIGALKEYIFSKKGSPLSLSTSFKPWSNRRGEVKQRWYAAQGDVAVKMIPLPNGASDFQPRLAAGLGGTFEVHNDFDAGSDPGNLFIVLSPSINYLAGQGIDEVIATDPASATRFLAGMDFRIGVDLGGERPLSLGVSGTASFKKLRGSGSAFSLVLSKEGF